jgi:hypothetical protein
VASYRGVSGTLLALENFLTTRMPDEFRNGPVNAHVALLGSRDIASPLNGNVLGIYMHRIAIDPHGRSRFFSQQGTESGGPVGELPLNLYFLLVATGSSAAIEADLMSWAMLEIANDGRLDISHLSEADDEWTDREIVNITPDEMSIETMMRIWDVFEADYTSSVPYVARTIRLRLREPRTEGPAVRTRVYPAGQAVR